MVKRIWNVLQQTGARWTRNDGNLLAASMAYYAAFSFFPLLLVLITALGFVLRFSASAQNAQTQLIELLSQNTSPGLAREVEHIMAEVQTRAVINTPVTLLVLLFGAIGIFSQLESAFARLWHDTTPQEYGVWAAVRNALWNRLKAFLTLIGLGVLVLVAFVGDLTLTGVRTWAEELPWAESLATNGSFWRWNQLALSIGLNAIVFTLLYKMVPRVPVRIVHAACGGIVVALVWQLGSQLVARFIVGGNYSAYGVVGSFIAMMLWVYCASILLFLGAQMVQVLGYPENALPSRPPAAAPPKPASNSPTSSPQSSRPTSPEPLSPKPPVG